MSMPPEMKSFFAGAFGRTAPTYDQTGVEFFTPFARRLIEVAELPVGASILDVGSGRGAALIAAARAVGPTGRVVGIDLAPEMVELTDAELLTAGLPQASIAVGDAENPPTTDGGWDAVVAAFVVFFLPSGPEVLKTWHGAIKPGGQLALSTFGEGDPRWKPLFDSLKPFVPPQVTPSQVAPGGWYSEDESLHAALEAANFSDIASTTETFTSTFTDANQWFEWSYSNGIRMMWESMSDDQLKQAHAGVFEHLESLKDADGAMRMTTDIRFTTARA